MSALLGAILAIGLFCWWLSGNWYAWAVAFTPAPISAGLLVLLFATDKWDRPNTPIVLILSLVFVAVWWLLTGIPYFVRIRPPYAVVAWKRLFA